jgi:histidinol-phosphate phosphatase family protein
VGIYRNLVPAAIYVLSPVVLDNIDDTKQDFVRDLLPRMIAQGAAVHAYNTPEYLRDTGTPERYAMVEKDIRSGLVAKMNLSYQRPAIFFDRDGVLNPEIDGMGLTHLDQMELLPNAAKAVHRVNKAGWLAVLTTNQPQVAKGFVTFQELDAIHAKLETLLGYERAKLDRIYFCPHHPEKGFEGEIPELKRDCVCRKPKSGMIARAAAELSIDLAASCVIGDTWRDVGAARSAGVSAYGVRTGVGCQDCGDKYQPDRVFADVLDATTHALRSAN